MSILFFLALATQTWRDEPVETYRRMVFVRDLEGPIAPATAVKFSPDGLRVVGGDARGQVHAWDPETGEKQWTRDGHYSDVRQIVFLSHGRFRTVGADGYAVEWNLADGERRGEPISLGDPSHLAPGGGLALIGGAWSVTERWLDFPQPPQAWNVPVVNPARMDWSPERRYYVIADPGEQSRLYLRGRRCPRPAIDREIEGPVHDVEIGPTVETLAYSARSEVQALDLAGAEIDRWSVGDGPIPLAYSPGGRCVFAGDTAGTTFIRDLDDRAEINALAAHEDAVNAIDVRYDGWMAATGGQDAVVKIWAPREMIWHDLAGEDAEPVVAACTSASGRLVAFAEESGRVRVVDLVTEEVVREIETSCAGITHLAISDDGETVAAAVEESGVLAWNEESDIVWSQPEPPGDVAAIAVSETGQEIAVVTTPPVEPPVLPPEEPPPGPPGQPPHEPPGQPPSEPPGIPVDPTPVPNTVVVTNVGTGEVVHEVAVTAPAVEAVAVSEASGGVVLGDSGGTLHVVTPDAPEPQTVPVGTGPIEAVQILPGGATAHASTAEGLSVVSLGETPQVVQSVAPESVAAAEGAAAIGWSAMGSPLMMAGGAVQIGFQGGWGTGPAALPFGVALEGGSDRR